MAEIWAEILNIRADAQVGIDDNFFELGGHSLKVLILISRVNKELCANIEIGDVFANPTVRQLARKLRVFDKKDYT